MARVFLDLETTHKNPSEAKIVQIGAVAVNPGEQIGADWMESNVSRTFNALVRPPESSYFREGVDIEQLRGRGLLKPIETLTAEQTAELQESLVRGAFDNLEVHKKPLENLFPAPGQTGPQFARPWEEVAPEFSAWFSKQNPTSVGGYNVLRYDRPILQAHGLDLLPENGKWIDVMHSVMSKLGLTKDYKLGQAAEYLNVAGGVQHDAAWDSLRTARVESQLANPDAVSAALLKLRGQQSAQKIAAVASSQAQARMSRIAGTEELISKARRNPIMTTAVGLGALMMWGGGVKPLSAFSGHKDVYNTITGMPEGGLAADLRHINTDFGSGYRGLNPNLTVQGQSIPLEVQGFRQAWYSNLGDPEAEADLKAQIRGSQETYDQFTASDMMSSGRFQRIHLDDFHTRWDDADTLMLKRKGFINGLFANEIAIRLVGIDAPETAHPDDPTSWFRFRQIQPHSAESTEMARRLTAGKDLEVLIDPAATTYGRHLGLLFAKGQDTSINEQLVAAGAAAHLPFGESGSDMYDRGAFAAAEESAISASKGMWSRPFFQSYLDLSRGVGGRVTFNTFTDLSRLAKNYNLAAAQQFMFSAEEAGGYDQAKAQRIGRSLAPSYGRFFSGQGRAFNTIEALAHGGQAEKGRKHFTDFGSGFKEIGKRLAGAAERSVTKGVSELSEKTSAGLVFKESSEQMAAAEAAVDRIVQQNKAKASAILEAENRKRIDEAVREGVQNRAKGKKQAVKNMTPEKHAQMMKEIEEWHVLREAYREKEARRFRKSGMVDVPRTSADEALAKKFKQQANPKRVASNIPDKKLDAMNAGTIMDPDQFGSPWKGLSSRRTNNIKAAIRRKKMSDMQLDGLATTSVHGLLGGKGHSRYTNKSK